jgi:hypothetical protein
MLFGRAHLSPFQSRMFFFLIKKKDQFKAVVSYFMDKIEGELILMQYSING